MVQQTSHAVWYHALSTSDHRSMPDAWQTTAQRIAEPEKPTSQVVALAARPDGSLVVVFGWGDQLRLMIRDAQGWGQMMDFDTEQPRRLTGPMVATGRDGTVHIAYVGGDGTAWYRTLSPQNELSAPAMLADALAKEVRDSGSVLPLGYLPETDSVLVAYRLADGTLWERRVSAGRLSEPTRISDLPVLHNPVDSFQPVADLVVDEGVVHVFFVDEASGTLYHARSEAPGRWSEPVALLRGSRVQWLRGSVLRGGTYGAVYDAGSDGGSGMNRYLSVPLRR